jgi:iron complex transport system ATP-binding protein
MWQTLDFPFAESKPPMTVSATLEITNLTVSYGERTVLENISLEIFPGEVLALIGPNGAGKSTLVKSLSGVLHPRHGSARVKGQDVYRLSSEQRAKVMAVVPQARNLPEGYTVWQTVLIGRTPYLGWLGQPTAKDIERTRWAMRRTGTGDYAERQIDELSGGEQQLLDEPTAHLDLRYQSLILNLVRELAQEQQLAVLMVLHDLNLVALYADRVALLVDGKLRAIGTPVEVITPTRLAEAYDVPLQVIPHPDNGTPLIIPGGQKLN